jgi:hypothetical protein
VGDSGTIYKTQDTGLFWQAQQSGTFARLNGVHFLDLDYGFAVGEEGTLLRTTTGGEPVTRMNVVSSNVYSYKLEQNYPNPFNPTTNIEFRVAKHGFVSLKIYDVLGNKITTLVNEEKPAGTYEVEFSVIGGSASGVDADKLTSGIYFYQLNAGNFVETKKMILIK